MRVKRLLACLVEARDYSSSSAAGLASCADGDAKVVVPRVDRNQYVSTDGRAPSTEKVYTQHRRIDIFNNDAVVQDA